MINKKVLKLFGFVKCRRKDWHDTGFGRLSYVNHELILYYDPAKHTDTQFAENLVRDIALCSRMRNAAVSDFVRAVRRPT